MKKIGKMAEMAWVIGTVLCAFGVVLCTKSGLGLSMMAAPPYILHITLRDLLPWFTQGTAQYLFEGSMLLVMCVLIGRFRLRFLLSFLSGVIYGVVLDLWLLVMGGNGQYVSMVARVMSFAAGIGCISLAVAFMFRTYLPPQIPELFVMRVADRFRAEQPRIKVLLLVSMMALHPLRESYMVFPVATMMLVRLLQPEMTLLPILVTLAGMVIEVRLLQAENAYSPILVTPSEMVREVRLLQV